MNNSSVLARFVKTRILKYNIVFQDDNNRVEIEEHLLKVQEGPLADKNDDQMNMAE